MKMMVMTHDLLDELLFYLDECHAILKKRGQLEEDMEKDMMQLCVRLYGILMETREAPPEFDIAIPINNEEADIIGMTIHIIDIMLQEFDNNVDYFRELVDVNVMYDNVRDFYNFVTMLSERTVNHD